MPQNAVYLEASERTQDLLNIKWTLQSAGYAIASTWHQGEVNTSPLAFQHHWNRRGVDQLQVCDSLVVICGKGDRAALELGMMAGFALARGLRVIWIGSPVAVLNDFRAVQQFNTPEDFRKDILNQAHPRSMSLTNDRLAAQSITKSSYTSGATRSIANASSLSPA